MGARAGSTASLYAGAGVGTAIVALEYFKGSSATVPSIFQLLLAGTTGWMMFQRYQEKGKFMPAGLVSILSVAYVLITALALSSKAKTR